MIIRSILISAITLILIPGSLLANGHNVSVGFFRGATGACYHPTAQAFFARSYYSPVATYYPAPSIQYLPVQAYCPPPAPIQYLPPVTTYQPVTYQPPPVTTYQPVTYQPPPVTTYQPVQQNYQPTTTYQPVAEQPVVGQSYLTSIPSYQSYQSYQSTPIYNEISANLYNQTVGRIYTQDFTRNRLYGGVHTRGAERTTTTTTTKTITRVNRR